MIPRLLKLPENASFFLFGPRATGKTTFLKSLPWFQNALYINLLSAQDENRFARNPDELLSVVRGLPAKIEHIVIDEVQKIPKLLDVVHELIETTNKKFILTGSSARKLRHGGANLLAGRAFVYHLFPFLYLELKDRFHLNDCLQWGLLPKIFDYKTEASKQRYLEAYTNTYLKEEIWAEQFVRQLDPFRYFLEVAAQSNGKLINFTKIARDVGVDVKTVQKYFSILEDTLIGFFLTPFQHSFRKRLSKTPKFYFFDPGVVRALSGILTIPLAEKTSAYGDQFEHFVILQLYAYASYYCPEYRFSFLKTKDDVEIDLVVERPGKKILFIEIKSSDIIQPYHLRHLKQVAADFGECETVCLSRDKYPKEIDSVRVLPWERGIDILNNGGKS